MASAQCTGFPHTLHNHSLLETTGVVSHPIIRVPHLTAIFGYIHPPAATTAVTLPLSWFQNGIPVHSSPVQYVSTCSVPSMHLVHVVALTLPRPSPPLRFPSPATTVWYSPRPSRRRPLCRPCPQRVRVAAKSRASHASQSYCTEYRQSAERVTVQPATAHLQPPPAATAGNTLRLRPPPGCRPPPNRPIKRRSRWRRPMGGRAACRRARSFLYQGNIGGAARRGRRIKASAMEGC